MRTGVSRRRLALLGNSGHETAARIRGASAPATPLGRLHGAPERRADAMGLVYFLLWRRVAHSDRRARGCTMREVSVAAADVSEVLREGSECLGPRCRRAACREGSVAIYIWCVRGWQSSARARRDRSGNRLVAGGMSRKEGSRGLMVSSVTVRTRHQLHVSTTPTSLISTMSKFAATMGQRDASKSTSSSISSYRLHHAAIS